MSATKTDAEHTETPPAGRPERKPLFEPGDMVSTSAGDVGLVISREALVRVRDGYREGNRPGRFFAPGCCAHPDYVTQVPVFFEDDTYDIMRTMNVKKRSGVPDATREALRRKTLTVGGGTGSTAKKGAGA